MAASASTPNQSLFSKPETLIGKYITILFQSNVRYEGICYSLDAQSNPPTIILAYVKDCGTEGREAIRGGSEVPPKDYLVEHMVFLASKIVGLKIIAVPNWNMIDTNNLPAQEYHRMLLHYATLNLMSPNSTYSLNEYGPVIHPMASSNIPINQMAPIFGNDYSNANIQRPTNKGKSIIIEPPTNVKGKSIQIQDPIGKGKSIQIQDPIGKGKSIVYDTGKEMASLVDAYKAHSIRSNQEYRNGSQPSPMKKTEETVVHPFFRDFGSSVETPMIISEIQRLQEVSLSDKKIIGRGAIGSSSTLGRGNMDRN